MNEPRTIFRECAVCGKSFEIQLSGKDHWWQKRKVLTPCLYGGKINLRDLRRGWFSSWLPHNFKSKSLVAQVMCRLFWWWSPPEAECTIPNWRKPSHMLWERIEDRLDPPEIVEYWEGPCCYRRDEA